MEYKKVYFKIHIAVNIQSKKIISIIKVTDEHVHDSKVLPKLVESIAKSKNDITLVRQGICRWRI
ncbi:MAG: transposase [Candidatus Nitrosocosmicus sp.]